MSFDIYGNRLERGFCEVHPHVRQEYPCDLCMNERQRQTVRASYPKCGICGKFESCADSCGVPVCSEGCAHEAERRSGEADGLRAALAAERERAGRAEADAARWQQAMGASVQDQHSAEVARLRLQAQVDGLVRAGDALIEAMFNYDDEDEHTHTELDGAEVDMRAALAAAKGEG